MKKFLTYATLAMFAVATVLTSCNNEEDVRVTGVTLSEANTYLPVPFTDTLIATITPENATNRNLIWTTTNEDIADVDRYGVVTAITPGEVTITVTTEDGNFSASRTYQIQAQHFPVTGITLNHTEWHTTAIGATQTLEATVEPANASFPAVKWTSDNENVATVSDEGVVTSVGGGTARIRATAVKYPEIYAECIVTMEIVDITSVTLSRDNSITLVFNPEEGLVGVVRLDATILPANATNRTVTWTISDPNIVEMHNSTATLIRVRARGLGTATITATAGDGSGIVAERTITVVASGIPDFCVDDNMVHITSAGFLTDRTWTVGNQVWSDVVVSDQCVPATQEWVTAEHGGMWNAGFRTHCRQSAEGFGHGFTWCAVVRFRDILCPEGWRVPTAQDFYNLDRALGGTGLAQNSNVAQNCPVAQRLETYHIPKWNAKSVIGSFAAMGTPPAFASPGLQGFFWSMTEATDLQVIGTNLVLPDPENPTAWRRIHPQGNNPKSTPAGLRCVRNI